MSTQVNSKTALLVMDMQVMLLTSLPDSQPVIANVAKAITHARQHTIPLIYVVVGFRPGAPEISMMNKSFAASRERMANTNPEDMLKIEPSIAPLSGEITVIKRRFSAFTGSDLEVVLRAQGIQHLVLTGVVTSGVVLSTVREAADKDYQLTVLSDACKDRDAEVHQVLMTKIFPRQAEVLKVEEWIKASV
ncbi:cysteine hydrolase [Cytophagaceae bacterium YF14B1]|uniref:Cysteine hydrolase n=1 Tax=Xanthocytophaga flava TaxID=3048013 RepID=A0AAE3QMQ5_9BACT|nr:cysteine hydrolase [Xanthocytophaga flavus]MDJ1481845.1 cysteine hydrolase [Xanthocytophaga flavus]